MNALQKQSVISDPNQHDYSTFAETNKRSVLTKNTKMSMLSAGIDGTVSYKEKSHDKQSAQGSSNMSRNSKYTGMSKNNRKKIKALVKLIEKKHYQHQLDFWLNLVT